MAPIAAVLAVIGSAVSIASGIKNMVSGPPKPPAAPTVASVAPKPLELAKPLTKPDGGDSEATKQAVAQADVEEKKKQAKASTFFKNRTKNEGLAGTTSTSIVRKTTLG